MRSDGRETGTRAAPRAATRADGAAPRTLTRGIRRSWDAELWWFLLPAALAVFAVVGIPLMHVAYLSLFDYNIMSFRNQYIGLGNYAKILQDTDFGWALLRTWWYVAVVVGTDFVYGFLVALLAWQLPLGWSKLFRAIVILPMILIPSAAAMLWRSVIYTPPYAIFDRLLGLPMSVSVLASPQTALWGIILTAIWGWSPWVFLLLLAGLEGLPTEPLEAARIDGASFPQLVWQVILPMMKPVIFITLSLKAVDSFLSFTFPWIMTEGGPGGSSHVLSTYIFERAFKFLDYGYGSSLGVVMLGIAVLTSASIIVYAWRQGYVGDGAS
ncbi:MAG: sugar ABC transporter permease [candidate division NC10 bacterium]|nr:sugar ABC transporter permease [candidate division NC10 bacterium]